MAKGKILTGVVKVRVLVLSDTHVPSRAPALPAQLWDEVEKADVVLHAGDFESEDMACDLQAASREFHAVRGNMDFGSLARFPDSQSLVLGGVRVALVHGHQWGRPRPGRVAQEFVGDADLVIYGHTHLPAVRDLGSLTVLNPGSPTCPRGHILPTYGLVIIDTGDIHIDIVQMAT